MGILVPKTKLQNILLWCTSLLATLLLAAVSSIIRQPMEQDINFRLVFNDVGQVLLYIAPAFLLGIGLPRLGGEERAKYVDKIGSEQATEVLKLAANSTSETIDYGKLADLLFEKNNRYLAEKRNLDVRGSQSEVVSGSTPLSKS